MQVYVLKATIIESQRVFKESERREASLLTRPCIVTTMATMTS
jgi:hypothetical protein